MASKWADHYQGELSEAAIRGIFNPPEKYRVSKFTYPAGTGFNGTMRSGMCFVLEGCCRYTFDSTMKLERGEFAVLDDGQYELQILGEQQLVIVLVWPIPAL